MKRYLSIFLVLVIFISIPSISVFAYEFADGRYGAGTFEDPIRYRQFRVDINLANDIFCPEAAFTVSIDGETMSSNETILADDKVTALNPMHAIVGDIALIDTSSSTIGSGTSLNMFDWQVTFRAEGSSTYQNVSGQATTNVFSTRNFTFNAPGTYNFYLNVRDNLNKALTMGWGNWAMNGKHEAIGINPGPTGDPTDNLYGFWYYAQIQVIVTDVNSYSLEEKHIDITTGETLYYEVHEDYRNSYDYRTYK